MACVALRGTNKTAWGAKLILTVDLAYLVSCATLGLLLMAHTAICFGPPMAPHLPPPPIPPPSTHQPSVCDTIAV